MSSRPAAASASAGRRSRAPTTSSGYFYQRGRQAWRSAISRYETIINDYPDYDKLDEVLYRYAECLAAAGRYAEALPAIGRLQKEYPSSQFVASAEKLRATFPPSAPTGPPTLTPPAAQPGTTGSAPAAQTKPADAPGTAVTPSTPAPAPQSTPPQHDATARPPQ